MITLLLVEDQPAVRQGLEMRLALEPDIHIVGEANDGTVAVELAQTLQPDVILMDVELPTMDGIVATSTLRRIVPQSAVVILTLHDDTLTRQRAQNAGAVAFVAKHETDTVLLSAIRQAAHSSP